MSGGGGGVRSRGSVRIGRFSFAGTRFVNQQWLLASCSLAISIWLSHWVIGSVSFGSKAESLNPFHLWPLWYVPFHLRIPLCCYTVCLGYFHARCNYPRLLSQELSRVRRDRLLQFRRHAIFQDTLANDIAIRKVHELSHFLSVSPEVDFLRHIRLRLGWSFRCVIS